MTIQEDLLALAADMLDAATALDGTEPDLADDLRADAATVAQTADQIDEQGEWLRRLVGQSDLGVAPEVVLSLEAEGALTFSGESSTPTGTGSVIFAATNTFTVISTFEGGPAFDGGAFQDDAFQTVPSFKYAVIVTTLPALASSVVARVSIDGEITSVLPALDSAATVAVIPQGASPALITVVLPALETMIETEETSWPEWLVSSGEEWLVRR